MFKIVYLQVIGLRIIFSDNPGGPGVKNLPANAGDTGSISSLGKVHMPQGNCAWAPQLLISCATTTEIHKPESLDSATKRSHCNEKPMNRN